MTGLIYYTPSGGGLNVPGSQSINALLESTCQALQIADAHSHRPTRAWRILIRLDGDYWRAELVIVSSATHPRLELDIMRLGLGERSLRDPVNLEVQIEGKKAGLRMERVAAGRARKMSILRAVRSLVERITGD
ncbi:hypothetical protein NpPPO83_00007673 [Neofusicoccum parvum]|uniref:Uncharacterized protein n=1 Tax=Neofusicoccum parvum TaxID=310453 RepID=A0ACB5SA34_9PEZI|nr:hypothetical protein NpPPO83_00007673 [Neofusicoccum parvum]